VEKESLVAGMKLSIITKAKIKAITTIFVIYNDNLDS
jgi:hypothetical protein